MNVNVPVGLIAVLLMTQSVVAQQTATSVALHHAIPPDVHLAVYVRDNPERAYQKEYLAEVWQTFQEEKIAERFFSAVPSLAAQTHPHNGPQRWRKGKRQNLGKGIGVG